MKDETGSRPKVKWKILKKVSTNNEKFKKCLWFKKK